MNRTRIENPVRNPLSHQNSDVGQMLRRAKHRWYDLAYRVRFALPPATEAWLGSAQRKQRQIISESGTGNEIEETTECRGSRKGRNWVTTRRPIDPSPDAAPSAHIRRFILVSARPYRCVRVKYRMSLLPCGPNGGSADPKVSPAAAVRCSLGQPQHGTICSGRSLSYLGTEHRRRLVDYSQLCHHSVRDVKAPDNASAVSFRAGWSGPI